MSHLIPARRSARRVAHATLVVAIILSTLTLSAVTAPTAGAAVPPMAEPGAQHVTADPLPTVQINGVVWDQAVVGNTVYVVGNFSQARPAGSPAGVNQTPRSNVLAYNITTGALIPGFVANANSQVRSVVPAPDGSRIYIAGQFTSVNGISRPRLAALNPTTGAVITDFNASTDYIVHDLAVTASTVYAGGPFNAAKGQPRSKLAAFAASDGALLDWAPSADATVRTLLVSPDGSRVFAGGHFLNVNGSSAYGMAALHPTTGALIPWAANTVVRNGGPDGAILDLNTDGTSIYGSGYTFGRASGNLEGVFKAHPTTGAIQWVEDCHGDTYQNLPMNGHVYKAGHFHFCGNTGGWPQSDDEHTQWGENMYHSMSLTDAVAGTLRRDNWSYHNLEGLPAPSVDSWFIKWQIGSFTGQSQATWSVDGNSQYLTYGGEFTRVDNMQQQGLVRFAVPSIAPNDEGPRLSEGSFPINVVSPAAGQVRVSFPANFDNDDLELTYQIQRNGTTVHTTTAESTFWDQTTVSFLDTGLTPGQSYQYRVRVNDADGNAAFSSFVPVVVSGTGPATPYANQVIADDARIYWRLGDAPGSATATDSAGVETGAVNAMTFGRPGAIVGDPDTAASPDSTSGRVVQPALVNLQGAEEGNPVVDELSVEAWFRTTSSQGGRLLGFGNSQTGSSSSTGHDRLLYVANDGRVLFGVRTRPEGTGVNTSRARRTVASSAGLNDGQWHHVVGTLAPDGMRLFVDGALVSSRSDVNSGNGYYGYWRVGADTVNSGWTAAPSSTRLNGDIDEAAVYQRALTPTQVANHWVLSGRSGNIPPSADFSWDPTGLDVAFDASDSDDLDGSITSYEWDFGDGGSGTGVTAGHTYAAAGTYTVTLTVTDDDGATGASSQSVTVSAPPPGNVAPVASFTVTPSGLDVSVNGSGSSDSDGSIASYAWDFGDGGSATGATAGHTYAAAGTYTVTLTVTDDDGATGASSQSVTVSAPPPGNVAPVASFTVTPSGLDVSVNGSGSSDSDGSIAGYAWDFGDGGSATGATAGHTYAAAGTYTVTLTVTDDDGATGASSQSVTVSEPGAAVVLAADAFGREVSGGMGSADVGGAWSTTANPIYYSVSGGAARHLLHAPGVTRQALLTGVSGGDVSGSVDVSFDKAPTGSGIYASLVARSVGSSNYQVRVRAMPTSTSISLLRVVNGTITTIAGVNVPGLVYSPGDVLRIELEAIGSGSTALGAKVWKVGEAEPSDWQVTATDTTAALQGPGGVGMVVYLGSATNAPVTTSWDNLSVTTPGSGEPPPGNVAPVASFTVTPSGLDVSVNGSGSSDSDGSIAGYAWDFGDGGSATGATAGHTYAAAGTYTVTLTVTDDDGATGASSQSVTVSAPPPGNVAPVASFTVTPSGLDVSVNGSGSSDSDGSIVGYAWDFGDGGSATGATAGHTYAAAGTYTVTLTVTDDDGATGASSQSVTVSEPGAAVVLAADAFGREVSGGMGSADVGGAWSTTANPIYYSVSGGAARHLLHAPGVTRQALLTGVSGGDVSGSVDVSFDKAPTGSGIYASLVARSVGSSNYQVRVRAMPTSTSISLLRVVNGTITTIAGVNVPGLVYSPGDVLRIELEAIGSGSTALGAKVWKVGEAEPSDWQVTATDTTAALQGPGGVGMVVYLGSATNAPVTTSWDNLLFTAVE